MNCESRQSCVTFERFQGTPWRMAPFPLTFPHVRWEKPSNSTLVRRRTMYFEPHGLPRRGTMTSPEVMAGPSMYRCQQDRSECFWYPKGWCWTFQIVPRRVRYCVSSTRTKLPFQIGLQRGSRKTGGPESDTYPFDFPKRSTNLSMAPAISFKICVSNSCSW